MKRLLLLFLYINAAAQVDTIFTKSQLVIPCSIKRVGLSALEYQDTLGAHRAMDLFIVEKFSRNGLLEAGGRRQPGQSMKKMDTVNVSDEIAYMRHCMNKFHKQYTTGMSLTLIGGALVGTSYFIKEDEKLQKGLGIAGIAVMIIGVATTMDAHRWIGKAGWGVSGKGSMIEVHYRFK